MHGDFPTLCFDYKCMFCVQCTAYMQHKRTRACGGGRQQPVPGHRRASRVNRHPQMRRTPGYPESMHCYEPFCTESAPHAAAVVRPRLRPAQKHRNSHRTLHQPKRRRMSDPELLEDTASPPARHVPVRATSTRVGVAGKEPAAATYAAHLRCQAPPPRTHAST